MDVNVPVDTTVSNTNECEVITDQNVENFATDAHNLFINDEEVRTIDEVSDAPENVVIVEEPDTAATIEGLIVNDNIVYQVAENTEEIQQFVTTECTTDGTVTYVTVAPIPSQDTVSTGFVEHVTSEKQDVEILQEAYENVTQDNIIVQEENYELPTQSYAKFVKDAIEGETEEAITVVAESTDGVTEIVEEVKPVEISEDVIEDHGTNECADSIEAKLQELTEGNVEQQTIEENGNEECVENVSLEISNVAVTEVANELSTKEEPLIDGSNANKTEEVYITDGYICAKDEAEQNIVDGTEISVSEAMVINTTQPSHDAIERQLSKIVHDEEPHQLSIAEEISRDFDDSDPEELTVSQQESHDGVIEEVVHIAKQLEHGPVTVTDNTGQVYYVESVEEVIVVENDSKLDDEKMSREEIVEEERPVPPPIPSHLLGRNIDNPVEDTFRNGKTPPKPRLGVKIPYKNLTSQIVSKEDIAKELLERSKTKLMQNRVSREAYFAKQLTRRLAKKISPASRQEEEKIKETEINNSDLIAILEGKDEEKHVQTKPQPEEGILLIDKKLERELALKQLSELPKRGRRRKDSGYDMIENVNIPPRVRRSDVKNEAREDFSAQKANHPKVIVEQSHRSIPIETVNIKIENSTMELDKQSPDIEEIESDTEINKTSKDVKKSNIDVKTLNVDEEKSKFALEKTDHEKRIIEEEKSNVETKKTDVEVKKLTVEMIKDPVERQKIIDSSKLKRDVPKVIVETSKQTIQKIEEAAKRDLKESLTISSKSTEDIEKKSSNPPIKTYERKRKSTDENIMPIPEKKQAVKKIPPDAYVTKSSRIIKKKIIWDPDDPTTSKFAADKISPQRIIKGASVRVIIKETRKIEPGSTESRPTVKLEKLVVQPEKVLSKPEKIEHLKIKSLDTVNKTKKRLSEVDRLLMDEGAVNLLYSVKNEETKKFTGTTISLDKIQKELMNKTNEIKRELTSSTDKISPKSLRKKESPAATPTKKPCPASTFRKKSKDSNRSSIHSPPASPSPMIYVNHADASRIIRRHSSSSYSSTEGDETNEGDKAVKKPAKKRLKKGVDEQPKTDKQKINDENFLKLEEENKYNNFNFDYSKFERYKRIKVGQLDNLVQVSLLCEELEKAYLSYDVLLELTDLLKELQGDDLCKVVVLSSTASSFCCGINYRSLHIEDEQIRKEVAQKLAKAVTEYLKTLANFPKIIIAGVQGECIGLAVTMLPLFDMVLASDTASFSIPNAKLGCAAEGGSLLSLPHLMHNALVSEMLYASRKFVAAEALRFGMVTRVIWPEKFQTELVSAVKEISTHSLQFKQITKRQLRNRMKHQIEESLAGEEDLLLETWISAECQKNFETYG